MKIHMELYRRKNGFYYVRYRRGKEQSLHTKDDALAKELFRGLNEEFLRGKILQLSSYKKITLSKFREKYTDNFRNGLADKTIRQDNLALKLLANVVGDDTLLSTIAAKAKYPKKSKIEEFKSFLIASKVKPVSINSYLRHIKIAFNIALENEIIDKVPQIKMMPKGKTLPVIIYPDKLEKILSKAKETDEEKWLFYMICIWTGARRAEAARADWSRINLDYDTIKFIGKGNRERVVTILPQLKAALEPHKKDIGPVFRDCHLDDYTHHFKALARSVGCPKEVHLHNLRHTAATYMLKSGIDIKTVSRILGHAAVSTTEIYVDVLDEMIKTQMQKLEFK